MKLLETINLSTGYLKKNSIAYLHRGLNISANPGMLIALCGPNGSGKTSLLKTLSAYIKPISGSVRVAGKPLNEFNEAELARTMSVLLTSSFHIPHVKVWEVVALGRYPYTGYGGWIKQTDRERINESLAYLKLHGFQDKLFEHLSDGEKQKVLLARSLAQDTELILLDEPTAYLDIPARMELVSLLKNICHNQGKTIVFSTHDLSLALQSADYLWLTGDNQQFYEGYPELLAYDGQVNLVFNNSSARFQMETYAFEFSSHKRSSIAVEFEPESWLLRALHRLEWKLEKGHARIVIRKTGRQFEAYDANLAELRHLNDREQLISYLYEKS